jgi:hypothetical protein
MADDGLIGVEIGADWASPSPTTTKLGAFLTIFSNCCAATKTGGRLEGDGAHGAFVQMTLNLRRQLAWLIPGDFQRFLDLRQDSGLEGDVDYRPAQGDDLTRVWPTRI